MTKRGKRREELRYRGMAPAGKRVVSGPLVIEPRSAGGVSVTIEASLAPPQRSMYADHVEVARSRDGVTMVFGKADEADSIRNGVEVSFPFKSFIDQLITSVVTQLPHQTEPFIETAKKSLAKFGYQPITELSRRKIDKAASIRSNAAFFALHEDDAAIDFFHLDAQVLHALSGALRQGFQLRNEIKGIVRIIVSPPVLVYLLQQCVNLATDVQIALNSGNQPPSLGPGVTNADD